MKSLLILALLAAPAAAADSVIDALVAGVSADPGLSADERTAISAALRQRFGKDGSRKNSGARRDAVRAAAGAVVEGTFDEAPAARIADVAYSAYRAAEDGADPEAAHGIALYGYREKISPEKVSEWATGYTKMTAKNVAPNVAAELVRQALERGWSKKTFAAVGKDLIGAAKKGLDQDRYASFVVETLAKNPAKDPSAALKAARRKFLPQAEKLLNARTPEQAAEGLIGILAGGPKAKPAARKRAKGRAAAEPQGPAVPPGTRMSKLWPPLHATAKSYLGTPYVWGGTTRKGIDCSGFTQNSYGENKVRIPRVSRDQWKTGAEVGFSGLRPGDLVFFNTMGVGVSHVGMVVEGSGPKFMHASSSKGVMIADLSKNYYKQRYLGARRVVD